jgi:hypothetical protein
MSEITNTESTLSVSDITARVDELREERAEHDKENGTVRDEEGKPFVDGDREPEPSLWEEENQDEAEELARLETLLDALEGMGFSHEWNGPDMLIAGYHFTDYTQEFAEEIGAVSRESNWIVIDWEETANRLKQDYKEVDFDGSAYWYRAT